ncbi:hypothetical protein V6Z11_A10G287700 [Gossypium hirsutum]
MMHVLNGVVFAFLLLLCGYYQCSSPSKFNHCLMLFQSSSFTVLENPKPQYQSNVTK